MRHPPPPEHKKTPGTSKRCTFSKRSHFSEHFCWTKQIEALCLWPTIFLLFFLIFWGFSLDFHVRRSGLWRDEYFLTSVPPVTNPCCTVGRWSRALRALSWQCQGHTAPSNTSSQVEHGASLATWEMNQKISPEIKLLLVWFCWYHFWKKKEHQSRIVCSESSSRALQSKIVGGSFLPPKNGGLQVHRETFWPRPTWFTWLPMWLPRRNWPECKRRCVR